ncbi:MAG: methyltransferase domain-containing protein [Armatimonadetes bacterium]|nr:methyltransferase domain-containing protein [Armatimonadota bacterium]
MLFNSVQFLLFFPLVTLVYYALPHRFRWMHLLLASCVFYCAFVPIYLLILVFTILVDYFAGIAIDGARGNRRKLFLLLSVCANVGVLAVFKYYNFFIGNINAVSGISLPLLQILLPIGLSFHTFQAMSYTIEVYAGRQEAERHLGLFSLYVLFYPQLVAGPIERPQNLLHQFREEKSFRSDDLLYGLRLMLWGFFKKVVIADRLAIYVNAVFAHPADFHFLNLLVATVFFSVQIYCDFSGYSDIAIGAARTMGFDLMTNFNRPYFAANIQDFWRRWHVSLSTWFRDYVYLPLGGRDAAGARRYYNLFVVFLLSGLWHGANWTFVVWGALHAAFVVAYLQVRKFVSQRLAGLPGVTVLSVLTTFACVTFAWIFFRANSLDDAILISSRILNGYQLVQFQPVVVDWATKREFGWADAGGNRLHLVGESAQARAEKEAGSGKGSSRLYRHGRNQLTAMPPVDHPAAEAATASPAACPVCAAPPLPRPVFGQGPWRVMACRACGHGWTLPRPSDDDLRRAYGIGDYYADRGMPASVVRPDDRARAAGLRARFGGTRLLDVGSGPGTFLAAAAEQGYAVVGSEWSAEMAAHAARTFGVDVRSGPFGGGQFEADAYFDVITMHHVLEHLPDPLAALDLARRLLAPGGTLILEVPNRRAMAARFPGKARRDVHDLPVHLHHFTSESLRKSIAAAGFDTVEVTPSIPHLLQAALAFVSRCRGTLRRFLARLASPSSAVAGAASGSGHPSSPERVAADSRGGDLVRWIRRHCPGIRLAAEAGTTKRS